MPDNSPFRSSSDLIVKVLDNLGVLAVGQPVDPEDVAKVSKNLDSLIRKLGGLEIVYVSDRDNIPGEWFADLADIIAGEVATSFGLTGQPLADMINKGLGGVGGIEIGAGTAAKSLKIMTRGKPTYERARTEYF